MPAPFIKICGLKEARHVHLLENLGVQFAGFVFFPASPRHITFAEAEAIGLKTVNSSVKRVAVTVDPDDEMLSNIISTLKPHLIQLHGNEPERRVHQLHQKLSIQGIGVTKAIQVATALDIELARKFEEISDYILLDAKPNTQQNSGVNSNSDSTALPGGNGEAFDWHLLKNTPLRKPWFLSGGINISNVGEAIQIANPPGIDTSSGVEIKPGIKDDARIKKFVSAIRY
jgi:phosphoribosylanthranilate isomerase